MKNNKTKQKKKMDHPYIVQISVFFQFSLEFLVISGCVLSFLNYDPYIVQKSVFCSFVLTSARSLLK